ncbi:restriction endonuclease subunit S [Campylobacter lanienae]|uniref:restriction endonuclease subunit S n=1 Tax=Campylobacter lanienae TaxID=75658 RepID=UPI00242E478F|nr:restriction endonuclease subunit S [Campylobacter lanienae]
MNKKKEIVPKFRFPKYVNSEQWISTELSSLLDYERPDLYIVESDNYKNEGIPVLTANKSFILGYTDEKNNIYSCVPVIIFDDFTTEKKYVDFPFKVKSSAIKILKPKGNNVLKFVFELMNTINFEAKEHKRYYIATYQKLFVCVPKDVKEQQKIADCLSSIDELIDAESRKLRVLEKYKKGLMQKLFPAEGKTLPEWRFPEFQGCGEWGIWTVEDSFETITPPKKIVKSEYNNSGKYPIVDQSQEYIAGWTDDETAIVPYHRPLIVFGDHTCVLKFMSQPFAQGADGIKILLANHKLDEKFAYYYLENVPLNSNGYQRHYSALKEFVIKFPDRNSGEQQKIADCLSEVDTMITEQSNKVEQLKAHKKGLMQGLFHSLEEEDE